MLGRNNWLITNDSDGKFRLLKKGYEILYVFKECNKGRPYNTTLKLSGCNKDEEFTCDDGQCIKIGNNRKKD